jgi:hypothetical protein
MGCWMTGRFRPLGGRLTRLTRLALLGALTAAWCAAGLAAPAPRAAAAAGAAGAAGMADAPPLGSPTWAATSTTPGASSSCTFSFATASGLVLTSVTMTVPAGTTAPAGQPTLGTVSPSGLLGPGTISLAGTTLTYTTTLAPTLAAGTPVSIQVNGLVNTTTPGIYTSTINTFGLLGASTGTGTTNSLTFPGPLSLTGPASLTWSAALTGAAQSKVDGMAADQKLTVDDATFSSAGWHVTVSATTFTNGGSKFPDTGTFVFNGSTSSIGSATAPSATCVVTCTLPANGTTPYPRAITTAATSPTPVTVFNAAAGSGLGAVTIGGSAATNPIGWWVNIPATARSGSYASTITVQVISGP